MDIFGEYTWYIITGLIVAAAAVLIYAVSRTMSQRVKGRRGQRLAISEYHEIDKTRRLVLVRRDNTEHLLLIGGDQDLVVETGIAGGTIAQRADVQEEDAEEPHARPVMRPAPRPAVFGDRPAPPLRAVTRDEPRLRPAGPFDQDR